MTEHEAFQLGICAAMDDLGITEPPAGLGLVGSEVAAWKAGLEEGYRLCDALWKSRKHERIGDEHDNHRG